ncbi:MAG: sugar phosphate isomerase/epimerase, partial [Caldilineaceae bacterium]|nr:sugar phosphate isomerase/epimerase [Caldilineaceae bacterium]
SVLSVPSVFTFITHRWYTRAMKFIFSTGSLYSYGTERSFAFAAKAGYDGIELMVDDRWDTRQADYLSVLVDRYGLPILAVHSPFRNVPGWPPDQPALIAESVKLAETLGARVVIHHLPNRLEFGFVRANKFQLQWPLRARGADQRYYQWLLDGYPQLQESTAVKLCIENMPARKWFGRKLNRHHWNTPETITRFSTLTLDTTHLGTWGIDPTPVYEAWGDRVGHIHLSNYNGREHRRPEHGELDLARFIQMLVTHNYSGAVSLELHPDALGAGKDDEHVIALMRGSLNHCRAWVTGETLSNKAAIGME